MPFFSSKNNIVIATSLLALILLCFIFYDGLAYMIRSWSTDVYSHGYFIPFTSLWFAWEYRRALADLSGRGHWIGLFLVFVGLCLGFMGELATLFAVIQYAFLITIFGLFLSFFGWQGVRLMWFPWAYLLFMIPLPNFLYNNLSSYLQLISSKLGVDFIRFCDISVSLKGNVIDLGVYQLQVVEACNGLNYLFPLASFGFLCSYFFRGAWWMRLLIFLSTLMITVLMNSFRIGVIGVLVDNWGIEQADGFLHDFEGWIIFVGCLLVLSAEMWLLVKLFYRDKAFSEVFVLAVRPHDSSTHIDESIDNSQSGIFSLPKSYFASLLLMMIVVPLTLWSGDGEEDIPERSRFSYFPLKIADWRGTEESMEQKFVKALKFDDYIIANYSRLGEASPINFYVAYYASQRKGASAHSPKSCIPGDGWRIGEFQQKTFVNIITKAGVALSVNTAIITKGEQKQLVYYWFQQRGRVITNEYLVKGYLFWDALTRSRTDGALVRLVVPVAEGDNVTNAKQNLDDFLAQLVPLLPRFIPD